MPKHVIIFINLEKHNQKVFLTFTDNGIGFNINAIKSKQYSGMGINNILAELIRFMVCANIIQNQIKALV